MKVFKLVAVSILFLGLGSLFLLSPPRARAADMPANVPAILQTGFGFWTKLSSPSVVLNAWRRGGLMERDPKVGSEMAYLARVQANIGSYLSYDVVDSRKLGQNSQILYISVNFERGAVYARFMLYHSNGDWVVQNMDFSTQPESLMPWLAFEGGNYNQ